MQFFRHAVLVKQNRKCAYAFDVHVDVGCSFNSLIHLSGFEGSFEYMLVIYVFFLHDTRNAWLYDAKIQWRYGNAVEMLIQIGII